MGKPHNNKGIKDGLKKAILALKPAETFVVTAGRRNYALQVAQELGVAITTRKSDKGKGWYVVRIRE